MSNIGGESKKKRLIISMIILAGTVLVTGLVINAITGYYRSQNPIYQCIDNPLSQPFQISIPIKITRDGNTVNVPSNIGISDNCTLPVHTLEENIIHIAYTRPYPFTLGHFLYNYKVDIAQYDATVYVNDKLYNDGSYLDLVLKEGMMIELRFTTK